MGMRFNGFDLGGSLDDIVQMAREFGEKMKDMAPEMGPMFESCCGGHSGQGGQGGRQSHMYFYPPVHSYATNDGGMVLEFALAGFDESGISVTFQGDFLVLSAKAPVGEGEGRFTGRGFRARDVERQKYRVPAEEYAQELAKAVFKNGLLTVTVPPKHGEGDGIKIEIVKEGN